jgi:hypothetical protein
MPFLDEAFVSAGAACNRYRTAVDERCGDRRIVPDTHTQRVLSLASRKGRLRASDLDAIDAPRVVLTRMTAAGLLEKIGRGLYRLPDSQASEHESLVTVATKVPQAVFCLLTALQFHELTTLLPRQVWIAMPRGSHAPQFDYPPIKMLQFTGEAFTAGVEELERDGVKLRVYGVATTVADCFKHRNKIGRGALARFSVTTFEAMRYLDVYHCPARILQLRKAGHRITTHWQTVVTEAGEKHRVGLYMREGSQ